MDEFKLFSPSHLHQQKLRARNKFANYRFLFDWCEKEILSSLDYIKPSFPRVALFNNRFSESFRKDLIAKKQVEHLIVLDTQGNDGCDIRFDAEFLPLAPASLDLIISIFDLHTINDLPGTLLQMRQALKPDGLFMACFPGGETLHELRDALVQAELKCLGGASPRVFPFVDKQQAGALLQRAGFSLPVVDSEIIAVSYRDIFHLMQDLRGMGETNSIRQRYKRFTPSRLFFEAAQHYQSQHSESDGKIKASFEMISLIGWAPHQSQQQPLRPGSAQKRIADALGTDEIKVCQ